MDSSSEGSFVWTDASDDTSDNETKDKADASINKSGEESESGKSYKKKLQQRLFSENEQETASKSPLPPDSTSSRKRLRSVHQSDDSTSSPKKKRVKAEPESDVDIHKKKNNKDKSRSQDSINDTYDETFLDSKVKSEQSFAVPSPVITRTKRRKSLAASNVHLSNGEHLESLDHQSHNDRTQEDSLAPGPSSSHVNQEIGTTITKKKKKKTHRKSGSESQQDDNISTEVYGTNVEDVTVEQQHNSTDMLSGSSMDTPHNTSNNNTDTSNFDNTTNSPCEPTPIISESILSKQRKRMSERIQFEDEVTDMQNKVQLSKYIKSSIHLRPCHFMAMNAQDLTDDNDVWLIRCPQEVKVEFFQDKKWNLDSKCKIKLDQQTYEGEVSDNKSNVTVLCAKNDKAVLKNVAISGCITFRRRLPKAHIEENNIMINNQTNFIPLPDTKCRHPLFGVNYKKSVKLPRSVAERLRPALGVTPSLNSIKKKKRRDRRKSEADDEDYSAPTKVEQETAAITHSVATKKKKSKRKHSTSTEESAPRHKRTKRDLESADAWDSEKAIEENLFNF